MQQLQLKRAAILPILTAGKAVHGIFADLQQTQYVLEDKW